MEELFNLLKGCVSEQCYNDILHLVENIIIEDNDTQSLYKKYHTPQEPKEGILNTKRGQSNLKKLQDWHAKVTSGGQTSFITNDELKANAASKTEDTNRKQAVRRQLANRAKKLEIKSTEEGPQQTQLKLF